jgi:2-iminoacetate synthase
MLRVRQGPADRPPHADRGRGRAGGALLTGRGFRHLLLVAGEHRVEVSPDYLVEIVERLRPRVPSLSIETQTWSDDTYQRLVRAGLEGVVHYQETYDRNRYAQTHVAGWKRDYDRRLNSTELAGAAGVRRLGIGALLGLAADWRADVLAVAAHAAFLVKTYWRTEVTVSLPRIKAVRVRLPPLVPSPTPSTSGAVGAAAVRAGGRDRAVHREPAAAGRAGPDRGDHDVGRLVDRAGRLLGPGQATEFSISDDRSPAEVAAMLEAAGYEPVWKDAFPLVG